MEGKPVTRGSKSGHVPAWLWWVFAGVAVTVAVVTLSIIFAGRPGSSVHDRIVVSKSINSSGGAVTTVDKFPTPISPPRSKLSSAAATTADASASKQTAAATTADVSATTAGVATLTQRKTDDAALKQTHGETTVAVAAANYTTTTTGASPTDAVAAASPIHDVAAASPTDAVAAASSTDAVAAASPTNGVAAAAPTNGVAAASPTNAVSAVEKPWWDPRSWGTTTQVQVGAAVAAAAGGSAAFLAHRHIKNKRKKGPVATRQYARALSMPSIPEDNVATFSTFPTRM